MHIPWRGWKDIIVRTYQESMNDRLMLLAASVVFYSIVALFPAIAAGVSSYALFADASVIGKHLAIASDIIPSGALDLLQGEITRIASKSDGRLTVGFVVGLSSRCGARRRQEGDFDALNVTTTGGETRPDLAERRIPVLHDVRDRRLCCWRWAQWWSFRCFSPRSASPAWTSR